MQEKMSRKILAAILLVLMTLAIPAMVLAKPAVVMPTAYLDKVRHHADQDSFRIVLELSSIPAYTVSVTETPHQVEIELPDTVNRSAVGQLSFVDPFIDKLRFVDLGGGRFKAVVSLKLPVLLLQMH